MSVAVRRGPKAESETLGFEINGTNPDFAIATESIADWSVKDVEQRHLDLLDIVGAIFAVDGRVTRGGDAHQKLGAAWRRGLDFDIEVRDPAFWNREDMRKRLVATVAFLTDDAPTFRFSQSHAVAPKQDYLQFHGRKSDPFEGKHVLLFSGGLDSLAGVLETLEQETGRIVLVTHRSAQKIRPRQDRLAEELKRRYPGRISYVPIQATHKNVRAGETTQRSRSLLFAAFGYVIARVIGADRLTFFENGVVSHNLPLSSMIVGTMATRTTHPLSLHLFGELLSALGTDFRVENRYQWLTKKEVIEKIRDHGCEDLIGDTVSCNHVWGRTRGETHCGACSQCLDRRFAILDAGLGSVESEDIYETKVLVGARETDRSRVLAQDWTRHALRLSDIEEADFLSVFGGDLGRIARGYPGVDRNEVLRRSLDLHRRHGASVKRVLKAEIKDRSVELIEKSLPPSCLFRGMVATLAQDPELIESGLRRSAHDVEESRVVLSESDELQVVLRESGRKMSVDIEGLGAVTGALARPVFALFQYYDDDRANGFAHSEHRFVPAGRLSPLAGDTKNAVAQNIGRCRQQLADFFIAINGRPPDEPLLIQTKRPKGYRLDPVAHVTMAD